jgi:hypothetical protein
MGVKQQKVGLQAGDRIHQTAQVPVVRQGIDGVGQRESGVDLGVSARILVVGKHFDHGRLD